MSVTARMEVRIQVFAAVDKEGKEYEELKWLAEITRGHIYRFRDLPKWLGELEVDVELKEVTDHGNTKDER